MVDEVVMDISIEGIDFFVFKCFLFIMDILALAFFGQQTASFLSCGIPEILYLFDSPQKGDATEEFDDFWLCE